MTNFKGILPAIVTPFTKDRDFSPQPMERLLERLYGAGADGAYVCGQTGEGLQQKIATRQSAAELAVQCSPRGKTVIVHVGALENVEAVQLARHARRIGAHAISSLAPRRSRTFNDIRKYYRRLAAASDLPLLIYHFPETCSLITSADQILELCDIPNVVGLKFTDYDLFKLWRIKTAGKVVFNGRDEVLAAGLLMGADGGIGSTYNLVPQLYVRLYALAKQGKWSEARRLQDKINELVSILLRFPLVPAIKTVLGWTGIDCGPCLSKPYNLSAAHQSALRELLGSSLEPALAGLITP